MQVRPAQDHALPGACARFKDARFGFARPGGAVGGATKPLSGSTDLVSTECRPAGLTAERAVTLPPSTHRPLKSSVELPCVTQLSGSSDRVHGLLHDMSAKQKRSLCNAPGKWAWLAGPSIGPAMQVASILSNALPARRGWIRVRQILPTGVPTPHLQASFDFLHSFPTP
jgi:hypothetical protein